MKFGGTSLGDRQRMQAAATIVAGAQGPRVVVVSAMGGVTDQLEQAGQAAAAGQRERAFELVERIAARHLELAADGPAPGERAPLLEEIEQRIAELSRLIEGAYLLREETPRSRALLLSFGERLAAPIIARLLAAGGCAAEAVDARELIVTDDHYQEARVAQAPTRERVRARLSALVERGVVPVVTGFIAATPEGVTTTLGRSGSDYSATLIASLLDAEEVQIWTDVNGILTADPRLVGEARTLPQVSYREAAEMSYFGARVIHPHTIVPAVHADIPLRILNSFEPDHPGTRIGGAPQPSPRGVKTVSSIDGLALVTIEGHGMIGVPGVARRIFEASEAASVNVVMISQASSEQTVSVVVRKPEAERLIGALRERFSAELVTHLVDSIRAEQDVAVVSIIGEGMAGRPGTAARLFDALAAVRVNVLSIAQGASELSISVAVAERDAGRAVRAIHTTFGLTRVAHLVLIGCGRVGQTLLELLEQTRPSLSQLGLELRLVAVADSKRLALEPAGIEPGQARERLAAGEARPTDAALIERLRAEAFTEVIVVDVTAADTAELHRAALAAGLHVVTANKRPLADSLAVHRGLLAAAQQSGARYGYETTFGAGLPVLHSLSELVDTGDALISVSGCLSGTLGFICTRLQQGAPLHEAVEQARELGYTEPDPREDLSGRDVARKALIIARAAGMAREPDDVQLEPLVPGLEAGLAPALEAFAPTLATQLAAAAERGEVLRYLAEITEERVTVGLRAVPAAGPIGALRGPDNILVFRTRRYDENPLVIQGPGAGAEVTAAGVLGDVLKISRAAAPPVVR